MKYLIYMSTSTQLFDDVGLKNILRQSQAKNLVYDITGMLLYCNGSFVQVLEGAHEDVDEIFAKIKKDKRHKNIIVLSEGELSERIFPFWSMGYKEVSHHDLTKFDAFLYPTEHHIFKQDSNHPAITILKTFAVTNNF